MEVCALDVVTVGKESARDLVDACERADGRPMGESACMPKALDKPLGTVGSGVIGVLISGGLESDVEVRVGVGTTCLGVEVSIRVRAGSGGVAPVQIPSRAIAANTRPRRELGPSTPVIRCFH